MIDVKPPTESEERWFGVVLLTFFGIVGGLILWRMDAAGLATTLFALGIALAAAYYALPPLRRPLYFGWMRLVAPIGWVVSNAALGLVYFGIVSPLGLVMRAARRDQLRLRRRPDASSHWIARSRSDDAARYFRQS